MEDIIIVAVLVLVIGLAAFYVYKAKKSGKKCIGCPDGGSCSCGTGKCGGSCPHCAGNAEDE
ncbi:MAG: FeoB-associated Cys-rich membrane protein [Clostridia bacterium]|nr:FeoB-associated Cys-rich membrane protein [Clostridia bacterium]